MNKLEKPVKLKRATPERLAHGKLTCPGCKQEVEFDVLPRAQPKPDGPPPIDPRQLPLEERSS